MDRNLDGYYFRVKRGEKFSNVCFSDLTHEERTEMMSGRDAEWMKSLYEGMIHSLNGLCEYLQITSPMDIIDPEQFTEGRDTDWYRNAADMAADFMIAVAEKYGVRGMD